MHASDARSFEPSETVKKGNGNWDVAEKIAMHARLYEPALDFFAMLVDIGWQPHVRHLGLRESEEDN
jgi:hypothetical protein